MLNFLREEEFYINKTKVEVLNKSHDASLPVSFIVHNHKKKFGVITDLGYADDIVQDRFNELNGALLEFNHDIDLLMNGPYPLFLKQRISSKVGHLSNFDASSVINNSTSSRFHVLVAAHLSETNNSPAKVRDVYRKLIKPYHSSLRTIIATKQTPTPLLDIR